MTKFQIQLWIDGMVPNPIFCRMMIFLPIAYNGLICFFLKYSKSKLKPKQNVPWIQWAILSSQTSHLTVRWMKISHFIYICFIHVLNAWHLCSKKLQTYKKWTSQHNFLYQNHCMKKFMKSWKFCSKLQCLPNLLLNLVFILSLYFLNHNFINV
jgi:hypothetical protein